MAFLLTLWVARAGSTPYERLLPQASVWTQEIDPRRLEASRPAEYRETLGVFPVGNGRCFAYLGLGLPQNTLFMMTGPRYQTDGDHNPMGGFGELAVSLREAGEAVALPVQSCRTVRGVPVVLTAEAGAGWRLTTVTAAPPGRKSILRWITVERLAGPETDVEVNLEFRGRARQRDAEGFFFEYPHRGRTARLRPVVVGETLEEHGDHLGFSVRRLVSGAPRTYVLALLFSETREEAAEEKEQVLRQPEELLEQTLSWWGRKLAPTLHVVRGDRRLDDLAVVAQFAQSAERMRRSIDHHFWLPVERRYAPALSPVDFTPHRAPFAPINLRPLWLGYLRPDDPRALSNLEATLRWLWRSPGLVRMTPFVDYFIGCAPGYLVYNLAAARHPKASSALAAMIGAASKSGEWVEVHKPDRPSYGWGDGVCANRLRPWESGINLDALLFYLTGARRSEGRSIQLNPLLPAGCDRVLVENLPIGAARLRLEVQRVGSRARYTVTNTSP